VREAQAYFIFAEAPDKNEKPSRGRERLVELKQSEQLYLATRDHLNTETPALRQLFNER